jgi:putative N6-adenine-specific DNA methylase
LTQLTAFEKRLKRQVIARPAEFFAVTAPGLEPLCLQEMQALSLSTSKKSVTTGGVTFAGHLQDCYRANLCLRTANRILMRINAFKASNFRTLEKNLSQFPWELYLQPGTLPGLQITTHRSRLHHSGAVADRFLSGITRRWSQMAIESPPDNSGPYDQRLFVRIMNDRFTVSLDSSGGNLYRRGLKKDVAAAPLRETVAAAVLILANYSPPEPLVDPMCGSGSFSLEAAMQARKIPAGWLREFAFYDWPVFRLTRKRWNYIRKGLQQVITDTKASAIFAADIDPAACDALGKNSADSGFSQTIRVSNRDFFNLLPEEFSRTPGLLTLNPPFGRRMGSMGQSNRMFDKLLNQMKTKWRGWKVGLVVPRQSLLKKIPFSTRHLSIHHGGLRLFLVAGRIPD